MDVKKRIHVGENDVLQLEIPKSSVPHEEMLALDKELRKRDCCLVAVLYLGDVACGFITTDSIEKHLISHPGHARLIVKTLRGRADLIEAMLKAGSTLPDNGKMDRLNSSIEDVKPVKEN